MKYYAREDAAMFDWLISIRLPAWVDAFLWTTGMAFGIGGLIVLINLLPNAPFARLNAKRMEGDELIADLETIREHNALHERKRKQIKTCFILSCGGFCILLIQMCGHW